MEFTDFTVNKEGPKSYHLTLPCFFSDTKFNEAVRMNRFYSSIMGKLYQVGEETTKTNERRVSYNCEYRVTQEGDALLVELLLTLRPSGRRAVRKIVSHTWNNGYIISAKVY